MAEQWGGRSAQQLGQLVLAEYGNICHLCSQLITDVVNDFSTDHVIPRSKGGSNDLSNLRPAHRSCNYARGNRSIEEFRSTRTNNLSWLHSLER